MLQFVVLLLFRGCEERFDVRISNHEVESVGSCTLELDRTWRLIAVQVSPFLSDLCEALEHRAIKLDKRFRDDRLVLSFSSFDAHHGWQRTASSNPFGWIGIS